MTLIQALVRNERGTCRPDAKGEAQADGLREARVPRQGLWGGPTCAGGVGEKAPSNGVKQKGQVGKIVLA